MTRKQAIDQITAEYSTLIDEQTALISAGDEIIKAREEALIKRDGLNNELQIKLDKINEYFDAKDLASKTLEEIM